MTLNRRAVRAPSFPKAQWINSTKPFSGSSLRGKVVLVDFWDFSCINCLRTLPYLQAWHRRYSPLGFVLLGVHTPEFSFAHDRHQVKSALARLGVSWPVVLDNEEKIWRAFANRYWPSQYLIDPDGYIRYKHAGEGNYAEIEGTIQSLLRMTNPEAALPEIMSPLRSEDSAGAVCFPITPELHLSEVGNKERILEAPSICAIPEERKDGQFYLSGLWKAEKDGLVMASEQGTIVLPYHAASVNGIFAPSSEPAELALGFPTTRTVEIRQDNSALQPTNSTPDLYFVESRAYLRVDEARSYTLVENVDVRPRELQLLVQGSGFSLYSFSFGSCTIPDLDTEGPTRT